MPLLFVILVSSFTITLVTVVIVECVVCTVVTVELVGVAVIVDSGCFLARDGYSDGSLLFKVQPNLVQTSFTKLSQSPTQVRHYGTGVIEYLNKHNRTREVGRQAHGSPALVEYLSG